MKKEDKIIIVLALMLMFLAGIIGYNMGESHVYSMDNEYYTHTEALLDSINNWNESFIDTVMESDTYYEYELARESNNK